VRVTKAVGDTLRANILRVLEKDAFSVLELCTMFETAQPAMSHHLKILSSAQLLTKRREGTSVFYQRASALGAPLVRAIFEALDDVPMDAALTTKVQTIHEQRAAQSRHFFAHNADALSQQQTLVCIPDVYTTSVIDTVNSLPDLARQDALEIGPGGGTLLNALAPHYRHVVGLDISAQMLDQAAPAVAGLTNVELLEGDFTKLPDTRRFDLIVAAMVLHHLPSPASLFSQAAHLLTEGGLLVIAELCEHDQDWVRDLCGDLWLGFDPEQLQRWATLSNLHRCEQKYLAQRNGFRVQVTAFRRSLASFQPNPLTPTPL